MDRPVLSRGTILGLSMSNHSVVRSVQDDTHSAAWPRPLGLGASVHQGVLEFPQSVLVSFWF